MYIRSGEDNTTSEASRIVDERLLRATDMLDVIDIITRGVRSTLESKKITSPEDLYGARTNCIGSYLHLESCLSCLAIKSRPALIVRYPWQQAESCHEIHILAAIEDAINDRVIIADPTPLSGYTYGQTFVAQSSKKFGHFDIIDRQLNAKTTCRILSDDEFRAIVELYKYELSEGEFDSVSRLYRQLETIPSYKARLLKILIDQTNDEIYINQLNRLPVESIRKSQSRYLTDKDAISRYETYQNQELRLCRLIGQQAIRVAINSQTYEDYARWISVAQQLDVIPDEKTSQDLPKSPLDIAESSSTPIYDYEKLMEEILSTKLNSNLYQDSRRLV